MVEISANPFIAEQLLIPHTMQLETLRFAVRRRHLRNDNSYIFLKLLFFLQPRRTESLTSPTPRRAATNLTMSDSV